MVGKAGAVIAAIAFSSASASVVGVIYTGFVSFRDDAAGISNRVGGFERAPMEAKVVLNPAKGQLTDLPPERTVPGCRDEVGPSRCILLLIPSPDLKLSFFGYTVSIPARWYVDAGTDDLYRGGQEQQFLQLFVDPATTNKNAPDGVDQVTSGDGGNDYAYSDAGGISGSSNYSISTDNLFIVADPLDPTVSSSSNPSSADDGVATNEVGPTAFPTVDSFRGLSTVPNTTIPEPSTWMMVLAGFAGLGLVRYRWRRWRWRARPVPPDCGTL